MKLFVDTSAFLAVLDEGDAGHVRAAKAWKDALSTDAALLAASRKHLSLVDCGFRCLPA